MSNNTRTFHEDLGSDGAQTATFDLESRRYKIVYQDHNHNSSSQEGTCAEFRSELTVEGTFKIGQNSYVIDSIDKGRAYLKNDTPHGTSMKDFDVGTEEVKTYFSLPMECQVDPSGSGIKGIPTISTNNEGSTFIPRRSFLLPEKK